MMDLFQLRCFVAVCEELHFSKAAARLHMTQSPLSRQIQLLEETVGTQLLERTTRSVLPTAAGTALYKDAVNILRMVEGALTNARQTAQGDVGRVSVGYTAAASYMLIPKLLLLAQQALSGVEIVLEEMVSVQQLRALADKAVDLAFVRPLPSDTDLLYHRVVREPMRLAVPAAHPLARKRRIAMADVAGLPLIMYSEKEGRYLHDKIKALFAATSMQPRYVHHMGQTHAILALVQAGIGIAIVPESAKHLRLEQVEFRNLWREDVVAEIYLAWRRIERNPAQQRLRELIIRSLG